MKDKSILEQIGVSQNIINKWKRDGLHITYPMVPKRKFYRSNDGDLFVETADKYAPPLDKQELKIYTTNPLFFKKDFLNNAKFFIRFCDYIVSIRGRTEGLNSTNKLVALLVLMYLFQSAMDHHYYHFDRYLAYEAYPQTPVGYWLEKLTRLYQKIYKQRVSSNNPSVEFLKLLSQDQEVLKQFEKGLSKKDFQFLQKILQNIKVFESAQNEEVEIIMNTKNNEHKFMRTGFPIWDKLLEIVKEHPELVKRKYLNKTRNILNGHPILGTRLILNPDGIACFQDDVVSSFKAELVKWTW